MPEPGKGVLDYPTAWQDDEALHVVAPLDDRQAQPRHLCHGKTAAAQARAAIRRAERLAEIGPTGRMEFDGQVFTRRRDLARYLAQRSGRGNAACLQGDAAAVLAEFAAEDAGRLAAAYGTFRGQTFLS